MSTSTTKTDFLLLFRGANWDRGLSPEEMQMVMSLVTGWFERLQRQGKVKGGQPLGDDGRTVSGKNGRTVDGPFAESKEAVGGYLLIQADDLDEAVTIAQACPNLAYGVSIEVRPVVEECPTLQRARKQLARATA
jgi:hypothetical protein